MVARGGHRGVNQQIDIDEDHARPRRARASSSSSSRFFSPFAQRQQGALRCRPRGAGAQRRYRLCPRRSRCGRRWIFRGESLASRLRENADEGYGDCEQRASAPTCNSTVEPSATPAGWPGVRSANALITLAMLTLAGLCPPKQDDAMTHTTRHESVRRPRIESRGRAPQ